LIVGAALLLTFATQPAWAQSATSGSISGTITDTTGAAVPGATVVLSNTDRGQDLRTLQTNATGFYTATSLPLGTYTIKVSAPGFKTDTVTGLVLHVEDALTVNRQLAVGGSTEVVTVTADEAQLNLQDATSQGLINSTQMDKMPLSSRNYVMLMNLQPGVAFGGSTDIVYRGPSNPSGSSNQVNFSVNGGRNTANNWTIDGADNLDRGANLTVYNYPSPDAIQEFKTLRGQYSAQYGRNAAGQVDVVTKSGTSQIHGSVYEYNRNEVYDANGYANNFLNIKRQPYRYNVFGFTVGGPVVLPRVYNGRNKTFFFVSEDWQKFIYYASGVAATVPQASERSGDFTQSGYFDNTTNTWTTGAINVCTAYTSDPTGNGGAGYNNCTASGTQISNISPLSQAYLKDVYSRIPVPDVQFNLSKNQDPHTILSNFRNTLDNLGTVVRIDQQFGQKLTVFYRMMYDTFPETFGQGHFGETSAIPGVTPAVVSNPGTQHLGHVTWTLNPTMVLNAGYAYSSGAINSNSIGFMAPDQSPDVQAPTMPYANTSNLIPMLKVSGMSDLGGSVHYATEGTDNQIFADLSKVFHNHTFTGGFSLNYYNKTENAGNGTQGTFSFSADSSWACLDPAVEPCVPMITPGSATAVSGEIAAQSFANFLTGNANGGFTQLSSDPHWHFKEMLWEAFVQDDWKATPRLTLNLGMRLSHYGQPSETNGILNSFLPSMYSAANAVTISNVGTYCGPWQTTACDQSLSNAGQSTTPNASADFVNVAGGLNYINGMIFGKPGASNNNQASPYGLKMGAGQTLNLAPRIGFAFDVFGDGKTSLRGGYGIAYDDPSLSWYAYDIIRNPPAVQTFSLGQGLFNNPTNGSSKAIPYPTTPLRIQAVPSNYRTPYTQQFSLDVQRQITPRTMVDIGYVANVSTHLIGGLNINQLMPGAWVGKVSPGQLLYPAGSANAGKPQCSDTFEGVPNTVAWYSAGCDMILNQIKPYQGYDAIDVMATAFSANYNSLQAKFTKNFKGKTYIDANFTWGRSLTDNPSASDYNTMAMDIYNLANDYGRSPLDRKFTLNVDGLWEEPWFHDQRGVAGRLLGGWMVSGIWAVNTGMPLTITSSGWYNTSYHLPNSGASVYNNQTTTGTVTDNAGIGIFGGTYASYRLDQIGNPNKGQPGVKIHNKAMHTAGQLWFYTGAFAAPDAINNQTVPANARPGSINGPGFGRVDLGVFRTFRIWERMDFTFRAEAYNATNHTNVNSIYTAQSSSYFGEVSGYRDARIMQFAGRITF